MLAFTGVVHLFRFNVSELTPSTLLSCRALLTVSEIGITEVLYRGTSAQGRGQWNIRLGYDIVVIIQFIVVGPKGQSLQLLKTLPLTSILVSIVVTRIQTLIAIGTSRVTMSVKSLPEKLSFRHMWWCSSEMRWLYRPLASIVTLYSSSGCILHRK